MPNANALPPKAIKKVRTRLHLVGYRFQQEDANRALAAIDKAAAGFVRKMKRLPSQNPHHRQLRMLCAVQRSHEKTICLIADLKPKNRKVVKRVRRAGFSENTLAVMKEILQGIERAIKRTNSRKDRNDGLTELASLARSIIRICERHGSRSIKNHDLHDMLAYFVDGADPHFHQKSITTAIKAARKPQSEESERSDEEEHEDME